MSEITTTKTHYIKEGKRYDRITSVLDYFATPQLVDWKMKLGKFASSKISKEAKKVGTRVDGLIKTHITTGKDKLTTNDGQAVVNCYRGYLQWTKDYSPKIECVDKTLFWEELGVAGTLDLEHKFDGVVDIKCSESIRKNYWLQVAMYTKMLEVTEGKKFKQMWVLRLDKMTGDYQCKSMDYSEAYVSLFIGLLANYRWQTQKEEEDGDTSAGDSKGSDVPTYGEVEKEYGF